MFVPNERGDYEALHDGSAPHRFLSAESIALFEKHGGERVKHCIVGRIVRLDAGVAQGAAGAPGNPHALAPGTPYVVVDACL